MNDPIVIDPDVQHGKPVIKGSRVPITRIIAGLAGGMTIMEITESEEDVRSALAFAGELVESEEFHPLRKAV